MDPTGAIEGVPKVSKTTRNNVIANYGNRKKRVQAAPRREEIQKVAPRRILIGDARRSNKRNNRHRYPGSEAFSE